MEQITFIYEAQDDTCDAYVERSFETNGALTRVLTEFTLFLHSIGFPYVAQLTADCEDISHSGDRI